MTAIKNNYIFQLAGDLPTSGTSVKISNDLERDQTVVFTSGYVVLRSGNKIERVKGSATGGTLTLSKRGLDQSDADVEVTALKKDWKEGTTCYVTVLAVQLQDVLDTIASGALLPPSYADDTARDAAITSPVNGMLIYNVADGLLNKYVGGAWVDDDGGAVVADASETVAGKLEEGTQAESDAGTSTGGTGAKLALTPLKAGRSVQANAWIKGADVGGDDTYVLTLTPAPTAYSDGMEVLIKPTTTNTGACTIDVNSLGVKNIKTPGGNDPSNGDLVTSRYNKLRYNGTDFIIMDGIQATTAEKGGTELATDEENKARTATDKVITPAQRALDVNLLTGTLSTSSSQTIAHGLGTIPRVIICQNIYTGHSQPGYFDTGTATYDGTTIKQKVLDRDNGGLYDGILRKGDSDGSISDPIEYNMRSVSAVDSTNITIAYTANGNNHSGTISYVIQVIA